jgi:hypothetical protein
VSSADVVDLDGRWQEWEAMPYPREHDGHAYFAAALALIEDVAAAEGAASAHRT